MERSDSIDDLDALLALDGSFGHDGSGDELLSSPTTLLNRMTGESPMPTLSPYSMMVQSSLSSPAGAQNPGSVSPTTLLNSLLETTIDRDTLRFAPPLTRIVEGISELDLSMATAQQIRQTSTLLLINHEA